MNKTYEVAKYEYLHHVTRRRFWVALLSIPIGFALLMFLSMYMSMASINKNPVGYIDQAGIITVPQVLPEKKGVFDIQIQLLPFSDEASARKAADSKEIQAYFIIPKYFESTYKIIYVGNQASGSEINSIIKDFIKENVISGETIQNLDRIKEGSKITLESLDGKTQLGKNSWTVVVAPVVTSLLFFAVVMISGGYLMQATVEEKENRTMEILVTSVSPSQLMTGKIIGNISVGLTQLLFWMILVTLGIVIFRDQLPFLSQINVSWSTLLISLAMMLPAFVLISALMATMGATVTDTQESQSLSGILVVPIIMPFYFTSLFMSNPNGLIARVLSYFPLSAPVAVSLRMAFTTLSAWELILIFGLLVVFAVGAVWLSGKAFRLGMLQYSKRIPLAQIFQKEA